MRAWMMSVICGGAIASAMASHGCIDPGTFACLDAEQCTLVPGGQCHPDGRCSYPSAQCPSGHAWSSNSGERAGQCVDPPEPTSPEPPTVCGDGTVDAGEDCDDGNPTDGDGCNADCRPSGHLQWLEPISLHPFDDALQDVAIAPNGDIVAVGYTSTEAAENIYDSDQYDFLFARLTATGQVLTTLSEMNVGRDQLRCLFVDPDGQVWVGGERRVSSQAELWLGRVEGNAFVTEVAYSEVHTKQTVGHDCVRTPGGRVVVVGMFDSDSADGYETWDRFVVYDVLGSKWERHLEAEVPLRDVAYAVAALPDDRIVVAGSTSRTLANKAERWVQLFDIRGRKVWEYVDGGPGDAQEEVFGVTIHGSTIFAAGATAINQGSLEREWLGVIELGMDASRLRYDVDGGRLRYDDDLRLEQPAVATTIAVGPSGALVIAGNIGTDNDLRGFVAKFDPDLRQRQWLQDELNVAKADHVTIDDDGSIVVVGSVSARGVNGPAFVARLAP